MERVGRLDAAPPWAAPFGPSPAGTVALRSCCGLKTADWILDLGPEGGNEGGRLIAEGTPEQVAKAKGSVTGLYLKPYLK